MNGLSVVQQQALEIISATGNVDLINGLLASWGDVPTNEETIAQVVPPPPPVANIVPPPSTKPTRASADDPSSWTEERLLVTPGRRDSSRRPGISLEEIARKMGFGTGTAPHFETYYKGILALEKRAQLTGDADTIDILERTHAKYGEDISAVKPAQTLIIAMMRLIDKGRVLDKGRAAEAAKPATPKTTGFTSVKPPARKSAPVAETVEKSEDADDPREHPKYVPTMERHQRLMADDAYLEYLRALRGQLAGVKIPGKKHEAYAVYDAERAEHRQDRLDREMCACAMYPTSDHITCYYAKVEQVANPHGKFGKAIV